jgi:hypothetical protein
VNRVTLLRNPKTRKKGTNGNGGTGVNDTGSGVKPPFLLKLTGGKKGKYRDRNRSASPTDGTTTADAATTGGRKKNILAPSGTDRVGTVKAHHVPSPSIRYTPT